MKKKYLFLIILIIMFTIAFSGCSNNLPDKLSVKFETNGGSNIETIKLSKGDKILKPNDPIKDGYIFDGWYISNTDFNDENKWNFIGYSVSDSMTLYAKWTAKTNISVSFDLCGGKGEASPIYSLTFDENYDTLPVCITKTGYKFDGWYTKENGLGTKINNNSQVKISTNHTLYANWINLFESGNGSKNNPYMIKTKEQLTDFAEQITHGETYSGIYIGLQVDIDLNNEEWSPAGSGENGFSGNFNGNGHIVKNYKITEDGSYIGFFGSTNGGIIENLSISNFNININSSNSIIYAGGLVGENSVYSHSEKAIIKNCSVIGEIYASGAEATVGGISGTNRGSIINCFSNVKVMSYSKSTNYSCYAGGLIGNDYGNVENSIAMGDVYAKKDNTREYVSYCSAGTLFGTKSGYSYTEKNNYYFENQVVIRQIGTTNYEGRKNGTICTKIDLENSNFYTSSLNWSNDIWSFENLNIEMGRYPILIKKNKSN